MAGVKSKKLKRLFVSMLLLMIYNEFLVYYIVLSQCHWPTIVTEPVNKNKIKVMILADVHLLGSREGHWFDKLRREWQMERSFQTSMAVHQPDIVFILGDLFDEGKWCSDSEFKYHVDRFYRKFSTPSSTQLFVVAGNHDMGFHYMIDDHKRTRFAQHLSAPLVRMVDVKGSIFILLNSMAFEGDRCSMCKEAEEQLQEVHRTLLCAKGLNASCSHTPVRFSDPILLQHFPLYRHSDSNCTGADSAPEDEKFVRMRSKWDCLDKDISKELLMKLKPRIVFSGHTHHFCVTHHGSIPEWNVPSFSWRYKKLSSFIMMSLTPTSFEISKCYLPNETTVMYTYLVGLPIIIIIIFFPVHLLPIKPRTKMI